MKKDESIEKKKIIKGKQPSEIFAKKGKQIVETGMNLILERLKCAKKYETTFYDIIRKIENECLTEKDEIKKITDMLSKTVYIDTKEILMLVTNIIEILHQSGETEKAEEILVRLDEKVEKWAQ